MKRLRRAHPSTVFLISLAAAWTFFCAAVVAESFVR